jgi:hypothetical protein
MYEGIPGTSPEFLELAKNSGNLIRIFKTTSMPTTAAAARHAWSESSEAQNGHGVVDTIQVPVSRNVFFPSFRVHKRPEASY